MGGIEDIPVLTPTPIKSPTVKSQSSTPVPTQATNGTSNPSKSFGAPIKTPEERFAELTSLFGADISNAGKPMVSKHTRTVSTSSMGGFVSSSGSATSGAPLSPDSEFGSFVSVAASEDPLASFTPFQTEFSSAVTTLPYVPPPLNPTPVVPSSHHVRNFSLSSLDPLKMDTKAAAPPNSTRNHLLDELLLHDNDPMYFLNKPPPQHPTTPPVVEPTSPKAQADSPLPSQKHPPDESLGRVDDGEKGLSTSLADLDLDFFSPKSPTLEHPISTTQSISIPDSHQHHTSHHHHSHHPGSSPTLTHAPTLAPPITDTSLASYSDNEYLFSDSESEPPSKDRSVPTLPSPHPHPPPKQPHRQTSYQTLSNISAKWIGSILPRDRVSTSPTTIKSNPFENVFNAPGSQSLIQEEPEHDFTRPHITRKHTPPVATHPIPTTGPSHIRTSSFSGGSLRSSGTVTHSYKTPFGPHHYVPPSGAPGFAGNQYDWDKGYSQELDRELLDGPHYSQQSRPHMVSHQSSASSSSLNLGGSEHLHPESSLSSSMHSMSPNRSEGISPGHSPMGTLMERKIGSIDLKGRKMLTTPVLETDLADLIRPHLPALSRLAKSWNLLYSLDQHGISLNTLYAKCEAPPPKPAGGLAGLGTGVGKIGALMVIKDSGDAVFGVWLGDGGIRQSKGKGYYGSGESFLFSYKDGNLHIFKWTGRNEYVALCEPEYLSFGGGDGHYGLYLDDSLLDGSSAPCPTFNNEPLCSPGPKKGLEISFECVGLEVWGIGA